MKFHILTVIPEHFKGFMNTSVIGRAQKNGLIDINILNIRDYTEDKHKKTDDTPFGGGPGMVLKAEPILRAIADIKKNHLKGGRSRTILFTPRGELYTNEYARKAVKSCTDIIMICGRYEGVDERVRKILKPTELSIGNYILTGGEIPAMVMIDSISRQIPGVLGKFESLEDERETSGRMYTQPAEFEWRGKKYKTPKILLSGNHKLINKWRKGE